MVAMLSSHYYCEVVDGCTDFVAVFLHNVVREKVNVYYIQRSSGISYYAFPSFRFPTLPIGNTA